MPSTTNTSHNPHDPGIRISTQRNEAFDEDEARLLYGSGRRNDAAAVPIALPTSRPMTMVQVKVPGGIRPTNTLNSNPATRPIRGRPKGGQPGPLALQASRGDNVAYSSHRKGLGGEWSVPSPKRQKISHVPSSPSSGTSTDELDRFSPDNVTFGPSQRSSQAVSMHSFNSQGSGLGPRRHGSIHSLTEHRNVERMMSSSAPPKKKSRDANRSEQRNYRLPAMTEASSPPHLIGISGPFEGDGTCSRPQVDGVPSSSHDTAKQWSPSDAEKPYTSKQTSFQAPARKSPYFPERASPDLPPKQVTRISKPKPPPLTSLSDNENCDVRLDERFIPVNGKHRSLENNQFSSDTDELQLGTTVGNNAAVETLSSTAESLKESLSRGSLSTLMATSPIKGDADLNLSDIKPTNFTNAKPREKDELSFSAPPIRERKAPWAVDVAAVSVDGESLTSKSMALVHDELHKCYIIKRLGRTIGVQITPKKLQKITWENSGHRLRFMSSVSNNEDHIVDLELCNEKDVTAVVKRLGPSSGCKTQGMPSEQIRKMFEKRKSEIRENISSTASNSSRNDDARLRTMESHLQRLPQSSGPDVEKPKIGRHRRSLIKELWDRAKSEEETSSRFQQPRPAPHLSQGDSVTDVLNKLQPSNKENRFERLKPNHKEHLRRSIRTSSEFKKPYSYVCNELGDNLGEDLAVEKYSKIHSLGGRWKQPLIYPKIGKKRATVEFSDLERLDEGEFLNDNLLSFYLRFLEHNLEQQRPDLAKRVYFFNTFFFATLMSTHKGKKGFNYEGVQKWTRNVDLFTFDYIVVPINEAAHWYLAIICNLPALNRSFSVSDSEVGLHPKSVMVREEKNTTEVSPPSLTSIPDQNGESPSSPIEDQKDPDEKGTRDSFADMHLDGDLTLPIEEGLSGQKSPQARPTNSINEDQEMLDVAKDALPGSGPDQVNIKAGQAQELDNNLSKDTDHIDKTATRLPRGKRKSGPPAVTRIAPESPVIITFDSLGMQRSATIKILKDYLREEAKAKRGGMECEPGQIKGITAREIPQQDNCYDCGVFLLGYVSKFLEDDPRDFIAKIIRREYKEFKDWPNLKPNSLRSSIREQIMKLHQDQVVERAKERDIKSNCKRDTKPNHEPRSRPGQVENQSRRVGEDVQRPRNEITEEDSKPDYPGKSTTRKEALETARSIREAHVKDISATIQAEENDQRGEVRAGQCIRQASEEEKQTSPGFHTSEDVSESKNDSVSIANEPSLILVESQSQPEGSVPKSFTNSHPAQVTPKLDRVSPELPAEIQDSQPSQTSNTVADNVRKTTIDEEETQEIPIEPLINPRAVKKRKTGPVSTVAALTGAHDEPQDNDVSVPNWTNTGNRYKRKRYTNKKTEIQKSDEVIQIDDD